MKSGLMISSLGILGLLAGCSQEVVAPAITPAFSQSPATVFFNELHYDNVGADAGEAVEVAGPAGTDLTGWSVVLYNAGSNAAASITYDTDALNGIIPDQGNGYGAVSLGYPANGIQNGSPDGFALVNAGNTVVQFLSYEGGMTASNGPASGLTSTDIGVAETGGDAAGLSLQLKGTGTTYQDFSWTAPSDDSFGAVNAGQTFGTGGGGPVEPAPEVCGDPATLISAVQGSGDASPLVGQTVTLEAVVVGDFQGAGGLGGFNLQEQASDQDTNPETSEGISVFAPGAEDVNVGQLVRVTGTVSEFGSNSTSTLTQLGNLTKLTVCGPADQPPVTELTLPLNEEPEQLEGMRVTLPQKLVIAEYFNYDRFGEIVLALPQDGLSRPYTPTSYVEPGAAAQAVAVDNLNRRITLDDGLSVQNPQVTRHPNGDPFSLTNRFRGGDTVTNTVGVLDERFGLYRIQPTQGADYAVVNPRTGAPEEVGGSLKVASFNVLNYFTTFGGANDRGADDQAEFERQQAKIVAALAAIGADVFGLIEIQNNGDTALESLVGALNAEVGAGTYSFVPTGTIGTDAIKVAFIYKPATVSPAGDFAVLDASKDARFIDTKNRPALIQTFDEVATGGRVTVAVNHFKSKGSDCNDVGDPDTGDGQGNCNETRTQAAAALADYLTTDPTSSGDPDFLIIGDLNSYDEEDPIRTLEAAGYTDLNEAFGGEFAYGYAFNGQFGYLDYALSSPALTPQVTGTTDWHINADEPDLLDYDTSFKSAGQDAIYAPDPYRSSDHDPVVVGLELDAQEQNPERDPEVLLDELQAKVRDLYYDRELTRGRTRVLLETLQNAERYLEQDRNAPAKRMLQRFERYVGFYNQRGYLDADIARDLQSDSRAIRDLL